MPETPEEMQARIEQEERIRAQVRQKIAAEQPRRKSEREEAQIMRLVGVICIFLAPAIIFIGLLTGTLFVILLGAGLFAVAIGCLIGAWVVGYS